jgi:5'-3' exoribonuclease 2
MGVPAFFRWITLRYPKVVVDASLRSFEKEVPPIDNLYIDLNGFIHSSTRKVTEVRPTQDSDVFTGIRRYLAALLEIVRPHKLLFIAVDGVAPRAKMNQQRMRRFKKAKVTTEGVFDSNKITPGTDFMAGLTVFLQTYITDVILTQWPGLEVVFSSSNVPGEGEHKILQFMRGQKRFKHISHCICGLDADILLLGLTSHESQVYILREGSFEYKNVCFFCRQPGHFAKDCTEEEQMSRERFLVVRLPILKEYLYYEFQELVQRPDFDFETALNDFVLLTYLVGNDFLPRLPALTIREGAIDGLLYSYRRVFPLLGGHLTGDGGEVYLERLQRIIKALGSVEAEYFNELQEMKESLECKKRLYSRRITDYFDQDSLHPESEVWKEEYYTEHFGCTAEEVSELKGEVCSAYCQGMVWVFKYYLTGCPSWKWFYPYRYAPFASDLANTTSGISSFDLGEALPPFAQLLAILPAGCAASLPDCLQPLMTPESPISDFYPTDFEVIKEDPRFPWEEVTVLPFIDESRLLAAYFALEPGLTPSDRVKNSALDPLLYSYKTEVELCPSIQCIPLFPPLFSLRVPSSAPYRSACTRPPKPCTITADLFRSGDRRSYGGLQFISSLARTTNFT